jgi:DNA-binding MarR family transcriptional regulator
MRRIGVLAERAFRHLGRPATASDLSHAIGTSPASARKVLARLELAHMVTSAPGRSADRRALVFTRVARAVFSHTALKHHIVPKHV